MSEKRYQAIADQVRETWVRACWTQWVTLGAAVTPDRELRSVSIIDPEALVLASLQLHSVEGRLLDLAGWWGRVGSRLVSVQRIQTLLRAFPTSPPGLLSLFASAALATGDRRWKQHRVEGLLQEPRSRKGPSTPRLAEDAALWLRVRAAFGVGAKADTLTYLLGRRSGAPSVRDVAVATGYSPVAIRTALHDMVLGRLIREIPGHPARYLCPPGIRTELVDWAGAEGGGSETFEEPNWRYWAQLFPFFGHVLFWAQEAQEKGLGERVAASKARDLFETHQDAIHLNAIPTPDLSAVRGPEFLDRFEEVLRIVTAWILEHV